MGRGGSLGRQPGPGGNLQVGACAQKAKTSAGKGQAPPMALMRAFGGLARLPAPLASSALCPFLSRVPGDPPWLLAMPVSPMRSAVVAACAQSTRPEHRLSLYVETGLCAPSNPEPALPPIPQPPGLAPTSRGWLSLACRFHVHTPLRVCPQHGGLQAVQKPPHPSQLAGTT